MLFFARDHNTKRAKLSIDVCTMFVAIFSNFAMAGARTGSNNRIGIFNVRADGTVCSPTLNSFFFFRESCARDGEVARNSPRREETATRGIQLSRFLFCAHGFCSFTCLARRCAAFLFSLIFLASRSQSCNVCGNREHFSQPLLIHQPIISQKYMT